MLHIEAAKHKLGSLNQFDAFDLKLPDTLRQVLIGLAKTSRTGFPVPVPCSHQIHYPAFLGTYRIQSAILKPRIESI